MVGENVQDHLASERSATARLRATNRLNTTTQKHHEKGKFMVKKNTNSRIGIVRAEQKKNTERPAEPSSLRGPVRKWR
jgi:hypothetical protein